jgi:hypothetical protein
MHAFVSVRPLVEQLDKNAVYDVSPFVIRSRIYFVTRYLPLLVYHLERKILRQSLKTNTSLVSLDLSNCQLGDIDMKYLCDGLAHHPTLRKLKLSRNSFSTRGTLQLVSMLEHSTSLRSLDVSGMRLPDHAASRILDVLACGKNTTLRKLDIRSLGEVTPNFVASLLRALNTKTFRLTTLWFDTYEFSMQGWDDLDSSPEIDLLYALDKNEHMKHFSCKFLLPWPLAEKFELDGIDKWIHTVATNTRLKTLTLCMSYGHIEYTPGFYFNRMARAIKCNTCITCIPVHPWDDRNCRSFVETELHRNTFHVMEKRELLLRWTPIFNLYKA